jgi:hypothetical protein
MRRALILAALAAVAVAPAAAEARPSLVVSAVAKGYHGGFENMNVQFACAAADVTGKPTVIRTCRFGSIYAPATGPCFECVTPPAAATSASGNVRLGLPYDLCVTAVSGTESVTKCAPFDYLTNSAVIAG